MKLTATLIKTSMVHCVHETNLTYLGVMTSDDHDDLAIRELQESHFNREHKEYIMCWAM